LVYKYIRLRGYFKYPAYLTTEMSHVKMIGKFVKIDASTRCQLKCPICPTGEKKNKKGIVGWGNLESRNFKKFLDENPGIKTLELSNWGEIFLNPGIEEIFGYAYLKGVRTMVGNGANLNRVKKKCWSAW
jgi:MoaA/NifB/PqqE/SkfB family radical SAM enzyme